MSKLSEKVAAEVGSKEKLRWENEQLAKERHEKAQQDRELALKLAQKGYTDLDTPPDVIKEAEAELKHEKQYSNYIFDEKEIWQDQEFFFSKMTPDVIGLGVFMAREKEIYHGRQFQYKTQINVPCIISSDGQMHEISPNFERQYKVRFPVMPDESNLKRRWSVASIKTYLQGLSPTIKLGDLFNKIKGDYKKFLYFHNDCWYDIHALWDIATYFCPILKYFPIFELRGLSGTAKTKIMTLSRQFSFNPTQELTNPSESTLFREGRKTKYIDECEKIFSFNQLTKKLEADDRAEVINSSYKYTGCVPRVEKIGNRFVTINYKTYSPVMLASINGLHGATESRAIVHITTKAPQGDPRFDMEPDESSSHFQEVRDDLYVFTLQEWKNIENAYNDFKIDTTLQERELWLWKPILLLAKQVDDDLFLRLKEFAEGQGNIKKADSQPQDDMLQTALRLIDIALEEHPGEFLHLQDIIKGFPVGKEPHPKTLSSRLDKAGLREYRSHDREGAGLLIGHGEFKEIISAQFPLFYSTHSSHSSQFLIKKENVVTQGDEQTILGD